MTYAMDSSRANRIAALGAVLSLPALLLFVSGMIQSATGAELMLLPDALLHPAVILGGLLVALVLNALVAVRLSTHAEETRHTLSLHLARRPANLAVLGLGLFLLGAILTYGFVENVLAVLP